MYDVRVENVVPFTSSFPQLSIARCSFIQLSELRRCSANIRLWANKMAKINTSLCPPDGLMEWCRHLAIQ